MRHKIFSGSFFTAVLLLATLLAVGIRAQAATPKDSPQVTKLLEDIKTQAADLQKDSDELESFTHSDLSWESHAQELNLIKERINAIGETIKKLHSLRPSASPWQREAIDRIIPVAQTLASNTTAAIEHVNKNPKHLQDPQYQQYLKSNAEAAVTLASLVKDFVEYGKTRTSLEALERKLEVPQ
ncbi:MAG TPA: hypothetical protein VOA64_19125 [Candidatus Dormibacteraeota bacterium]|nr:hypothetical protein [Candidatus Dormibacteraeota bacterium]